MLQQLRLSWQQPYSCMQHGAKAERLHLLDHQAQPAGCLLMQEVVLVLLSELPVQPQHGDPAAHNLQPHVQSTPPA